LGCRPQQRPGVGIPRRACVGVGVLGGGGTVRDCAAPLLAARPRRGQGTTQPRCWPRAGGCTEHMIGDTAAGEYRPLFLLRDGNVPMGVLCGGGDGCIILPKLPDSSDRDNSARTGSPIYQE
jgi:hypothetical protein